MGSWHRWVSRCDNFWRKEYKQKSSEGLAHLTTRFSQQELCLQLANLCVEGIRTMTQSVHTLIEGMQQGMQKQDKHIHTHTGIKAGYTLPVPSQPSSGKTKIYGMPPLKRPSTPFTHTQRSKEGNLILIALDECLLVRFISLCSLSLCTECPLPLHLHFLRMSTA